MTNAYVGVCGRRLVVVVVLAMSCYMCSGTQVGMAMSGVQLVTLSR